METVFDAGVRISRTVLINYVSCDVIEDEGADTTRKYQRNRAPLGDGVCRENNENV